MLRLVDKNWKAFFKAIKEWQAHPSRFLGRPRIPRYKPKNGEILVIFTNQQCRIKAGFVCFPKKTRLPPIKTRIAVMFHQIRLVPRGNHYILVIIYEKKPVNLTLDKHRVVSIDLGLNNLVTVVNNAGLVPWRVKGGVIKSVNQFYNKERARLTSLSAQQGLTSQTRRIQRLQLKRTNKIADVFHKVSRRVIEYCLVNDFGTIVIGYNKMWKQCSGLGQRNNQNFVSVPFLKLVQKIHYKAAIVGIEVIMIDEGHTSKVSFIDGEEIKHHQTYVGKRVCRGLFQTSNGVIMNADVNGTYNIGRKAVPEAFEVDGIEGVGLHPDSVTV